MLSAALTRRLSISIFSLLAVACFSQAFAADRPNILVAMADDQSWLHTSSAGYRAVSTPTLDRLCQSGVRFTQCIAGSPGCSPSRAALLTGLHHWQLSEAGTHASNFPIRLQTYPDLLAKSGYFVGLTGKGWGPGNWAITGRPHNPAGPSFDDAKLTPPNAGIHADDYAGNFAEFLKQRPKDQPFCFWYGSHEPHRTYATDSEPKRQKKMEDADVPPFLPDVPEVRSDLLSYCVEIEWFDRQLGRMLDQLREAGELDNTLVIVTADNGMSFPRAKATTYEYGIHVPLAISWPKQVPGNRVIDDLVGFVDLTATILEATSTPGSPVDSVKERPVGKSLLATLKTQQQGIVDPTRTMVFSGRERHSSARPHNWGYPSRALRTQQYLYIRNFHPERWPAGDPQELGQDGKLGPMHGAYRDIDAGPSLAFLVKNADSPQFKPLFELAVGKRHEEELYDIRTDAGCLKNLSKMSEHQKTLVELRDAMTECLVRTGDPRMGENPEVWETYPRYSAIRQFPDESQK